MNNPTDLWIASDDWRMYESYVLGSLQRRFPGARVMPNVHVPGIKSGHPRQIDVLVEVSAGGFSLKIAFDCKCYGRNVDVNDVETFLGMLDDLQISKGVLVTTKGYSKTAIERAKRESRDIDLQILAADRLSEYQFVGDAWLWRGPVLAAVGTPDGWLVDNQDTGKPGWCQFAMYPLGHTLESAKRMCPFLYGNIVLKSQKEPTMEAIAKRHEEVIWVEFPNAKFERLPPPFPSSVIA